MKRKRSKQKIIDITDTGSSIQFRFRPSLETWKSVLRVLFILGIAWTYFTRMPNAGGGADKLSASPQVGYPAPDFTLELLEGGEVSLADFKGKVVLVNIWASWCLPCRTEMPAIENVYQEYKDRGFVVLGVNTTYQDTLQDAADFIDQVGVTFPILLDRTGKVSSDYQLRGLPTSYFIDQDGVIRAIIVGGPMSEVVIRTNIETLLETP